MSAINSQINLGPLRTNAKCPYRKPRIAKEFQVEVEPFERSQDWTSPPKPVRRTRRRERFETGPVTLWIPNKISERSVEIYMDFVRSLFFNDKMDYSEERALYFLHRCDYDVHKAKSLLSLKEPIADEESESESEDAPGYDEEDFCFVCGDGGSLILCDVDGCRKVYHCHCASLQDVPSGKWECPSHFCDICKGSAPPAFRCSYCPTSYCKKHVPQELTDAEEAEIEFLCKDCHAQKKSTKQRFLKRLHELMKRRGEHLSRFPRIGGAELDLFLLYKTVIRFGGAKKVNDGLLWSRVRDILQIPASATNAASVIKSNYLKTLYPYEQLYFPESVSLDDKQQTKRRKFGKRKRRSASSGGLYDIVFTSECEDAYKIEMNVDGHIRHGIIFKSQVGLVSDVRPQMLQRTSPRRTGFLNQQRTARFADTVHKVRSLMKRMQLTQAQLGKQMGCAQETISAFLNGRQTAARYGLPEKLKQWAIDCELQLAQTSYRGSVSVADPDNENDPNKRRKHDHDHE